MVLPPPRWEGRVAGADGEVPERVAAGGVEVVLVHLEAAGRRQVHGGGLPVVLLRRAGGGQYEEHDDRHEDRPPRSTSGRRRRRAIPGRHAFEQMLAQEFVGGEGLPGHVAHADLTVSTLELSFRHLASSLVGARLPRSDPSVRSVQGRTVGSLDAVRRGPITTWCSIEAPIPASGISSRTIRISTMATAAPIPIAATIISTPTTF